MVQIIESTREYIHQELGDTVKQQVEYDSMKISHNDY